MSKLISLNEAKQLFRDDMTIMVGGFSVCGLPEHMSSLLCRSNCKNITLITSNSGTDDFGFGPLFKEGRVKKIYVSYVGESKVVEKQVIDKDIDIEFVPQGTLAERIRAGGCGLAGFYTATGVGSAISKGKETREFRGRTYMLETALRADLALIKAHKADTHGNLTYHKAAQNFNPVMATAADVVVAEVEEMVQAGSIDPDAIVTPGVFVDHVIMGIHFEKRIEKRVFRKLADFNK